MGGSVIVVYHDNLSLIPKLTLKPVKNVSKGSVVGRWLFVSDVSELYKQLSSKKYREIKRHQIQYDAIMNCVIPFND